MQDKSADIVDYYKSTEDWQKLASGIVILPVGSLEQHSNHLPLITDTICGEYFGRFLAKELGAGLLPPVSIYQAYEHSNIRGSITLSIETAVGIIRDIAACLEKQNFTRLIVLNSHGGNYLLGPVIREINSKEGKLRILMTSPGAHDLSKVELSNKYGDIHGGQWETSMMMALFPDLVNEEKRLQHAEHEIDPRFSQNDLNSFGLGHITKSGIWGNPQKASREAGEKIVASIKENMPKDVRRMLDLAGEYAGYNGKGPVAVRSMEEKDIVKGEEFCRIAGWNQLASDWDLFVSSGDAEGFVAVNNGEVCGTASIINYKNLCSWIGMVLVNPEKRRMGIGTKLLNACIERLDELGCDCIKLDATPIGKTVYDNLGFVDEYMLSRMVVDSMPEVQADSSVKKMSDDDLESVVGLDKKVFGVAREELIRHLFVNAGEYANVIYGADNELAGFSLGRHGFKREHIGPIVAKDTTTAKALASACFSILSGKAVLTDITHTDEVWRSWLEDTGFSEERPFIRMYKGKNLAGENLEYSYSIAGPELG
ncbi:MAG: GNAT family N-acetyltransferase [Planctomycetota bacterium]|jgi:creatinine amidohydrolase